MKKKSYKEKDKLRSLSHLSKEFLDDLNAEARGWIIDRMLQIEAGINKIIINFYEPTNELHFKTILLNSSILDFGSKLKILSNIEDINNKLIEKTRKLASIRNGFAHAPINQRINIDLTPNKQNTSIDSCISVMKSSGKIDTKNAVDYLEEFHELYEEVRKELSIIINN